MKILLKIICFILCVPTCFSQTKDTVVSYKKRVLETVEVDVLSSYYKQTGSNAAVTGGIGNEELTDITPTIVVSLPLNADDVLTVDFGISAYTSASSSNLDPFDASGASAGFDNDDNDDDGQNGQSNSNITGSPWVASSGASRQDVWGNLSVSYAHNSDDRNKIWSAHGSVSTEYDYFSVGFGGSYSRLFNQKNTEIGISGQVYLDKWLPRYPTELDSYLEVNGDLNQGFFQGVTILDQNGQASSGWSPIDGFALIQDKSRNTFSASLSFSQILSKNAQFSLFLDVVQQKGWLGNPMQRVYFADRANYFIGNANSIPNYTSPDNTDVFQLADDIERLPISRFKIPIGARFNYYLNETFVLRTYYRYYTDNWGIKSHTASLEVPIKVSGKFTLYPNYRFYTQTAANYFAPFEQNVSTQEYYTSDFDLSKFEAHQYGFGVGYTDIFTSFKIFKFGLKSINLRYNHYNRSTGLNANIISGAFKFMLD
ncbi:MAG: DUF3570 domain-containing protein [Gilvibacter sp.]